MRRLFSRRDSLPAEVVQAVTAAVPHGTEVRVLAWARNESTNPLTGEQQASYAVGLPAMLVFQDPHGDQPQAWQTVGWHRIARGGWKAEEQLLVWTDYDGAEQALALSQPGSLTELFRERVQASILVQRQVPVAGTKHGVVVVGRRVLGVEPASMQWHATLNKGTRWTDPGAKEAAEEALAELKADYDPGL